MEPFRPRVHFITLTTADLDAVRAFYRDGLGWEPLADVPGEIIFFQIGPGLVLGFFEAQKFGQDIGFDAAPSAVSGLTLSHNVDSRADVDATVKAAVDALTESAGSVVLTASVASRNAGVGGAVYTASKHAVVGLVEQLAFELAPNVRVNGVAPGFMRTDIRGPRALGLADRTLGSMPDLDELARALLPMQFLPDPSDYTGHFVQLASRANAAATTGVVVECDGGFSVRGMGPPPGQ